MARQALQHSMAAQKVAAYISLVKQNESVWGGVLIFLGALMLLGSIPFYPVYLVFLLAAACGAVGSRNPPVGLILSFLLGLLSVLYQSPVFAWFYLLIVVLVLFQAFKDWLMIAALQIFILAPFAFGGLPFSGWISIVGMALGALYFGSRRSLAISLSSITLILLLSSIWLVQNTAYLPLKMELYQPGKAELLFTRPAAGLGDMAGGLASGIGLFFSSIIGIWSSIGWVLENALILLTQDSMLLQLAGWAAALFLLGWLPPKIKNRPQLTSSLSLLILLPAYYAIGAIYGTPMRLEFAAGIFATIALLGGLEQFKVSISRESEIGRQEKMKAYGKFGMADMSLGGAEKSMADVGGYEDVKTELRDAIIMPLEKKDIAYAYGIRPPTGILLFGPPGTGKTMLMRALAKELKYNFIEVRCSQILSQWYGESLPYDEKLVVKDEAGRITRMEIGEIVEERKRLRVLSFDGSGRAVFADIKDWIKHRSTSPIYEVRTRTGRRIRVTDYHSLFSLDGMKIESVPTSRLVAGKSYIAIPKRIGFSQKPMAQIRFLEALRKDDHGMFVKNGAEHVKKAVSILGRKRVAEVLHYKNAGYLAQILHHGVGVRVQRFLELMKEAKVDIDAKNIRIGSGSKTLPGIISIDERLATFIGLWVAEGSYNRQDTVRISTSEKELERISGICRELFGKTTVYRKGGGKGRDIYLGSRPLYVLFRHVLGLEDGAKRKKMPEIAFNLGNENLAALLRGYFSGDGTIYENQRGVAMVEGSTVSRELADQILHLLLYFGIVGTVYEKKERSGSTSHRIYMTGGRALTRFREIGFLDSGRMARLDASLGRVKWFREEQIPITTAMLERSQGALTTWENSATMGRGMFDDAMAYHEDGEFKADNDIHLDRVEEIRQMPDEEFVYDISVDPCQNFVAGFGGIFAHNSEKNVKEVFDNARNNAPTVLFFDEIDAVAKKRSADSLDEVGQRVLSELLQQIDGASKSQKTVMVVGATNRPDQLDAAMLRPGRLDKIIYMHLPDPDARKAILEVNMRGLPIGDDVDLDKLARKTERFSGADIKNIVTEAKGLAAKEATKTGKVVPLSMAHFMRIVNSVKPSTGLAQLDTYEQFRMDFERRVGKERPAEEAEDKESAVRWDDVAGLDDVKRALLEAIELPLLHEAEMKEFKVKPSKGILLFGPPGTGKTLIVKAAASELKASFQSLSAAEVMKKGYTQAMGVIKEAFNRARENPPGIIFVDEIETFAPARGAGGSSEIIGQFLTEMDGVKGQRGVVVLAATNKPALMDAAIMRPGRFDKIFYIPPPGPMGRRAIFKIHLGRFAEGIDLKALADATDGFTGADIAEVCQSAKMRSLRAKLAKKPESVTTETVLEIIKTRRPSVTEDLLDEYRRFLKAYGERR